MKCVFGGHCPSGMVKCVTRETIKKEIKERCGKRKLVFPGNRADKNNSLKTVSKIVSTAKRRRQTKWEKRKTRTSRLKGM